jgi:hypothetical protein
MQQFLVVIMECVSLWRFDSAQNIFGHILNYNSAQEINELKSFF